MLTKQDKEWAYEQALLYQLLSFSTRVHQCGSSEREPWQGSNRQSLLMLHAQQGQLKWRSLVCRFNLEVMLFFSWAWNTLGVQGKVKHLAWKEPEQWLISKSCSGFKNSVRDQPGQGQPNPIQYFSADAAELQHQRKRTNTPWFWGDLCRFPLQGAAHAPLSLLH